MYALSIAFACQQAVLLCLFLIALQRVLAKYYRRLSPVARYFLVSFSVYFLVQLVTTVALKVYFTRHSAQGDRLKMFNVLVKPLPAYLYLKYCYAVFLADKMQAAFRGRNDPSHLRRRHFSKKSKWRIFFAFQIVSDVTVYSLWAYLQFSGQSPPEVDTNKASGSDPRLAMLIALTAVSMIKAIVDLFLFCYSVRVVHALVRRLQPRPSAFQLFMRACGYFAATLLFFTGTIVRDIITYGISEWRDRGVGQSLESALDLLEAIEATVTIYLAYSFAFSVLAVLYHFGSLAQPRNPTQK